jgi:hypothetical protein
MRASSSDGPRIAAACENTPGDPGEFVGERNDELYPVHALGGGLDPVFEAMPIPARWSQPDLQLIGAIRQPSCLSLRGLARHAVFV